MFVYIAQWLEQFHSGFSAFQSLTLRGICSALTALLISLMIGPPMIRWLSSYKIGQSVLTHTDEQVFVAVPAGDGFTWQSISQDLTSSPVGAGISNVAASRATPGLYGAAYSVAAAKSGNNKFFCRVLHTARAFEDANQCPSALGGGDCQ